MVVGGQNQARAEEDKRTMDIVVSMEKNYGVLMPGQNSQRFDSGDFSTLSRMLPHKRDAILVAEVHNEFT